MSNDRESASDTQRSSGWRCDTCRGFIARIEDGWVEWLACEEEAERPSMRGLRLVHRRDASPTEGGCEYDSHREFQQNGSIVEGLSLERFVGPDGLMLLLSLIASGDFSAGEVIELTKRVQIPGYEQARDFFQMAIESGYLSPSIAIGFYLQSEIQAVLRCGPDTAEPV